MKKLVIALVMVGGYCSVYADATPVRGVPMACVRNTLSEPITIRASITSYNDLDFDNISVAEFTVPANNSGCKEVANKYEGWAWQAWNRPHLTMSFAAKGETGNIITQNSAYVNFYNIWDKRVYLENTDNTLFSIGHLNMHGNPPWGNYGYSLSTGELQEKTKYTYHKGNTSYYCWDSWDYNCGVTAVWWDVAKDN